MPLYKKRSKYIPGTEVRKAFAQVYSESKKVGSKDTYNRDYVVITTVEYIKKEGLSEEEALDKIMKDPVVKEFSYFEKYNIDIKERFREWVRKELEHPKRSLRIENKEDNKER